METLTIILTEPQQIYLHYIIRSRYSYLSKLLETNTLTKKEYTEHMEILKELQHKIDPTLY
jgi:hypothetical protein